MDDDGTADGQGEEKKRKKEEKTITNHKRNNPADISFDQLAILCCTSWREVETDVVNKGISVWGGGGPGIYPP
jgi:hypothetical protein